MRLSVAVIAAAFKVISSSKKMHPAIATTNTAGLFLVAIAVCPAAADDCKSITDPVARLACFDKTGPENPPRQMRSLDFETVKNAMNARYAAYFAHHKTSLIGSKTVGDKKIFYIKVPDPNPSLQIVASCLSLDQGSWMCTLVPNYGTFGALPLPIR